MAIAFDASTSANGFFDTSFSEPLTVGTLTDGIILAAVCFPDDTATITAITAGGVAMTLVGLAAVSGGNRISVYRRLAPASGAVSVAVTLSGSQIWAMGLASWQGVDQTTPFGTPATASGDNTGPLTVNVGTSAGNVVLDFVTWAAGEGATSLSIGASQTSRLNDNTGSPGVAMSNETASGGTTTMSWTFSAGTHQWATLAAVMNEAAGGGGGTDGWKVLLH